MKKERKKKRDTYSKPKLIIHGKIKEVFTKYTKAPGEI